MSTDQPTLADYAPDPEPASEPEPQPLAGATTEANRSSEGSYDHCRTCDAYVSAYLRRVVGDNDGMVPVCENCTEFSTTASAVNAHRTRPDGSARL